MYYLTDAALFALVPLVSILLGWWSAHPKRSGLENLLIPGAVALGAYALLIWLFGTTPGVGFTTLLLLLFLLPKDITSVQHRQTFSNQARATWRALQSLRGLDLILFSYLFLIFGITFILALVPPSSADYDSLVYHLAAPAQFLRAGAIHELPYDHHTYFPLTMEMLYLVGLKLHGPVLAKLFHWWMLPLSCGALIAIGQRHFSLRAGLWAAVLFASLPVAQAEASTAYIDLGLTAFSLLAFLCFANWITTEDNWWLLWSGVFCGFCLGLKYLGALTFGWFLLWAIGQGVRTRKLQPSALISFCVVAMAIGGVWYIRNWWWTGNPVFPFAYGVFHGRGWTSDMAQAYTTDQMRYGFGRSLNDYLWLPWRVAMTPLNIGVVGHEVIGLPFWPLTDATLNNPAQAGLFEVQGLLLETVIGPLLLALGAPLIFMKRKPPIIGLALWTFAVFAVFWALTGQYIRYMLPSLALLCLACGWGVTVYLRRNAFLKWTVAFALGAWLIFAPIYTLRRAQHTFGVIAGQVTPENYLLHTFPAYDAMQWASHNTPTKARFAVYGEPRCFYLERDYFWADDAHNNLVDYTQIHSGADLINALQRLGATHVLWNMTPGTNGGVFGPPLSPMQEAIQQGLLKPLYESRGYGVYEITHFGKASR